jgi:hypothetical protein
MTHSGKLTRHPKLPAKLTVLINATLGLGLILTGLRQDTVPYSVGERRSSGPPESVSPYLLGSCRSPRVPNSF